MQTSLLAVADLTWPAVWPFAATVLLGGTALYWLLPRPRLRPVYGAAVLGLVALVLAGLLVVPASLASPESILFYTFSLLAILAGAQLVTQKNPARAALSFSLVILSTCGLFLLLGAPFLMAATIIIYAGAIIVTFLFVLMLAQQEGRSDADERSREPFLATCSGFLLLFLLLYLLQQSYGTQVLDQLGEETHRVMALDSPEAIDREVAEPAGTPSKSESLFAHYKTVFDRKGWKDLRNQVEDIELAGWPEAQHQDVAARREQLGSLLRLAGQGRSRLGWLQPERTDLPLSTYSGPPATTPPEEVRRDDAGLPRLPAANSSYLGRSLFTDYLIPVELGGTLLLVATVAAIAIAQRREAGRST